MGLMSWLRGGRGAVTLAPVAMPLSPWGPTVVNALM